MKSIIERMTDFNKAINPPEPESYTKNVVVFENPLLKLHMYRFAPNAGSPILVIRPDAGHRGIGLVDKGPDKSFIETMYDATTGSLFLLDWKGATQETKNATYEDYILAIHEARWQASGQRKTHMVGLCAGGTKAAIYTALFPETVSRLSINGTPIDFRIGGGNMVKIVDSTPQSTCEMVVRMNNGVMPGWLMLLNWMGMNWDKRFIGDYADLWAATAQGKEAEYDRIYTHRSWYIPTEDIPGPLWLKTYDDLFRHNKLVNKEFYIGEYLVDLADISCPVDVINGDRDDITSIAQCFALSNHVSTPENLITRTILEDVGHTGSFNSKKAQPKLHKLFSK